MKIVSEMPLRDFRFWSGAKDTAAELSVEQLDQVERVLEELYPDGMTDTQINDIFWFERDTVREWVGISEYPKWVAFKSKLGNQRLVEVTDETGENQMERRFYKYGVEASWYGNDEEPSFSDVTGYNLDASDYGDFEEWLWEEDNNEHEYLLYLPKHWMAAYEKNDHTGFGEIDESEFAQFISDYKDELTNKDKWFYLWDTDYTEFRNNLDYGGVGECVALRIYKKAE